MKDVIVHKAGSCWLAEVNLPEDNELQKNNEIPTEVQTVIILDRSGSMGMFSSKMVNDVFPLMLKELGYKDDDKITLVTFDSIVECFTVKVRDLHSLSCTSRGCTKMAGVFQKLVSTIHESTTYLRILTLSDGSLHDHRETMNKASEVAAVLKPQYHIVSKAVRLITSNYSQPDTSGLASVLQFDTETENEDSSNQALVDVEANLSSKNMAVILAGLYNKNSFKSSSSIESSNPIFLREPWSDRVLRSVRVKGGKNVLWLKSFPDGQFLMHDGKYSLRVVEGDPLSHETFYTVLGDMINYYLKQLKLLRVIGNQQSMETSERIVKYFKDLEMSLGPPDDLQTLVKTGSLRNRVKYLQKLATRKLKSVTIQMETIANDERVASLNQAQKADYLRQVDTSSNAKGLARRAEVGGLDFNMVAKKEIKRIASHIHELSNVSDNEHAVSFYSQATTKEALMELTNLVNETESCIFENFNAYELLQLFNVVGIPCSSSVGEYPDPMTYRVHKLFPGYYLSIADLTIAATMGGHLCIPGTSNRIDNIIPVFENIKLQKFLQQYAPTMLEYSASIGMRRIIANVPKTFISSIASGVWCMVIDLNSSKSEVNVKSFKTLVNTLNDTHANIDPMMTLITKERDEDLHRKAHFLDHNGIMEIIKPMVRLVLLKQVKELSSVLRSLYSYEFYSMIKKKCKGKETDDYRGSILDELLGIDYEVHGTLLPPMFEDESSTNPVVHFHGYNICEHKLKELKDLVWFVKYVTLLVPYFKRVFEKHENDLELVRSFKQIPELNEEIICKYLGIDFSYKKFVLYNVVEGLLYRNKQSRIGKESNLPLLPDLGMNKGSYGEDMIKNTIQSRYECEYKQRLAVQVRQEMVLLRKKLVKQLLSTDNMTYFCQLLKRGTKIGSKSYIMTGHDSPGFKELITTLLNVNKEESTIADKIPLPLNKLRILYIGKDEDGNMVWNNGNVLREGLPQLKDVFIKFKKSNEWNGFETYIRSQIHQYRESGLKNRHGHSNNFPSYFGLGYPTLEAFKKASTPETWGKYCKEHRGCCGL